MPLRLILGKASPGAGSGGTVSPRVYGTRMDALYTAKLTEFRMYAGATANFRGCVYNSDLDLLWQGASTPCTINTWESQVISPEVSVTDTVEFALALKGDATNTQKYEIDAAYDSWIEISGQTFENDFPDPGTEAIPQAGRTYLYQAWGWILPTITAVNAGSSIATTDTNIPITGADFMPTQGTGVITMANNADWDLATVKTPQVLGSSGWGDSTVYFDATGLSAGTWYAFVTTDLDQRNLVGESVTVTGGGVGDGYHEGQSVVDASAASGTGIGQHGGESVVDASSLLAAGISDHSGESVIDDASGVAFGAGIGDELSVADVAAGLAYGYGVHIEESLADVAAAVGIGISVHAGESLSDFSEAVGVGVGGHVGESIVDIGEAIATADDAAYHIAISVIDVATAVAIGIAAHAGESAMDSESAEAPGIGTHGAVSSIDLESAVAIGFGDHSAVSVADVGEATATSIADAAYHIGISVQDISDASGVGIVVHSGVSISDIASAVATAVATDEVDTTVYASAIAMARRLIAKKGQLVTWRQVRNVANATQPWKPQSRVITNNDAYVVFLPYDMFGRNSQQYRKEEEVPRGIEYGLMAHTTFSPRLKDVVIRGGSEMVVENIKTIAPNGEKILYQVGLAT